MIHKKMMMLGITLFLLLILYTIATASGWQDSSQSFAADPGTLVSETTGQIAGAADAYSVRVAPGTGNANHSGYLLFGNTGSSYSGEVQVAALEERFNSTWLIEWMAQGIGALALLTAGLLGLFFLSQHSRRA